MFILSVINVIFSNAVATIYGEVDSQQFYVNKSEVTLYLKKKNKRKERTKKKRKRESDLILSIYGNINSDNVTINGHHFLTGSHASIISPFVNFVAVVVAVNPFDTFFISGTIIFLFLFIFIIRLFSF